MSLHELGMHNVAKVSFILQMATKAGFNFFLTQQPVAESIKNLF